jgi:hypothetical protein
MIGNVALDVVIGLIFIYLLYSLYATVIMEMVSSVLGLRARNLSYALSRMLMDEKDYPKRPVWKGLARLSATFTRVTGKTLNMKNPELFEKFFNQPSIKYLSSGGIGNTPSYLSAENFSKALIDSIKLDRPEIGELLRIQMGLRTWTFRNDDVKPFLGDPETENIPEERRQMIREIESMIALSQHDTFKFKVLLEKWFIENSGRKSFEVVLPSERSETIRQIESLLDDANNDLVKFKMLLENWYNDTMERASGWFKQTTQVFLIIIGAVLTFSFEIDTIAIIQQLSRNTEAREQLVQMAINFNDQNADLIDRINRGNDSLNTEKLDARLKALESIKDSLSNDIKNARQIVATPPGKGWSRTCGYLLTIIALSLGAPFWFDLLNKVVKLRTSKGVSEKFDGGTNQELNASNRNILNRAG